MPVRNIPRYAFHFGLLQVLPGTYWGGNQWPDGLTVSIRIWAQPRLPDVPSISREPLSPVDSILGDTLDVIAALSSASESVDHTGG